MLTKKDKHLAAAQKLLERGHDHRALEEFSRVVEEDPSDTRTWLKMAEIHVRHGALAEAREIYLHTAEIYLAQGFPQKAATVYRSVLKLTPGLPEVRLRLSDAYRQMGDVADALHELELAVGELAPAGRPSVVLPALRRMVELQPDDVVFRIRLAEAALQAGRTEEAVGELGRAAEQLKKEGRGDELVRVAERLLFHQPKNFAIARDLAATYIARKNPRLALAKLQGPLQAAPRDPENVALLAEAMAQLDAPRAISVWRELAEIHASAGRTRARDQAVRSALALGPGDEETRNLAARWGIALPTPTPMPAAPRPAASSIESAVTNVELLSRPAAAPPAPADEELAGELEQLDFFVQQSLHEEAQAVLVDLEQRFPGHPLLAERRRAYASGGPGAVPRATVESSHSSGPIARLSPSENADPATHGDLGIAYKQMGLYDAAVEEFRKLAVDKSRAVFALTMIGECVEAKGELGEAVARYKEALNLPQATPQESIGLYYSLGSVFEQLGDVREALYFFENVGKRNPAFRDVKRRIVTLKTPSAEQS